MTSLDLKKTALIMIDLQKGIVGRDGLAPYSGQEILDKNEQIAEQLKNTDALIVCVHVKNYGPEALAPKTDAPATAASKLPADFSNFVLEVANDPEVNNVIHVAKHNWGAFYGTDLDVQLRRRGIETVILTGIATTIGCDTTAREAIQHGYHVIAVEDAMTDFNGQFHHDDVEYIFKRLGQVRSTAEILELLKK